MSVHYATQATNVVLDVPGINSSANIETRDVIGNKEDDHDGDSIYAKAETMEEHMHGAAKILPDRGNAIQAAASATPWLYGNASASLGTPADDFDIHWLEVIANNNDEYQFQVYVGGVAVGEGCFERINVQTRSFSQPFMMDIVAPGAITIKLASRAGSSTATFKVHYHVY